MRATVLVAVVCFGLAGATHARPNSWVFTLGSASQLTLTWSNTDGTVGGFLIERSTDATNFSQIARVSPSPLSYRDIGLAPTTTYYYRVRAYNSAGFSPYSAVASNTSLASSGTNSQVTAFNGYWDDGVHWSLAVPPSTADSSDFVTNSTSTTVMADSFTAGFFPNALTISNLTLSAPAGSTNTLFLNGINGWGVQLPLEILKGFTIGNGAVLVITNSVLQVDGLSGGSLSVDGSVTMLDGLLVTTNASFVVGNQSVGSFTMYGGTAATRDVTVAARTGAAGTLSVDGGAMTANSLTVTNSAGLLILSAGTLSGAGATFNNGSQFADGDGSHGATYRLLGGVHAFVNGLRVRNNAVLSGCGTITGTVVVDPVGSVVADCGGTLTFVGSVTNNGTIRAMNGSVLESYAPVINNGVLNFIMGNTNFHSALINNGIVLDPGRTNDSWINSIGGKWETAANWSLGLAPFNQLSAFITNTSTKTVTLDAITTNTPDTMTINMLTLSAPNGSTNTLALNNVGTMTALLVLSNFIADVNGAVVVRNSTLMMPNCFTLSCTTFIIGNSGGGNQMTISAGGQVQTGDGQLGFGSSSSNNTVLVTDSGSVWNDYSELNVGYSGSGNSLVISNGGVVNGFESFVGYGSSSSNNTVLVIGRGSVWNGYYHLDVGYSGSGNSLVISNGGVAQNLRGSVGYGSSSSNNTVLVTDSGSVWNDYSELNVGYSGSGNSLVISNGGVVNGFEAFVGYGSSSSNNTVLVTGSGSIWNGFFDINVGYNGSSNSLVISNGGLVYDGYGFGCVGFYSSSSNNTVLVTGSNSVWSVGNLFVGCDQSNYGNTVVITNYGSVVVNNGLLIGTTNTPIGSASIGNRVSICGSGSLLVGGALSIAASNSLSFCSGFLGSAGTAVTNGQTFVVGDGTSAATFTLLGGVHSFANGLEIRSNAVLCGCGTISGNVLLDGGGALLGDCAGTLTFTGVVTNRGTMQVINGSVLEAYGTLVNNGTISIANGYINFYGAFINNGTIVGGNSLGAGSAFQITSISLQGNDVHLTWTTTGGSTNVVQATDGVSNGGYATNFVDISAPIVVVGAGTATTNYVEVGAAINKPARYYRVRGAPLFLPPPSATASVIGYNRISLNWSNGSGSATGFLIERSVNGGAFGVLAIVAGNATNFVDRTVSCNNSYAYGIASISAPGVGSYSYTPALSTAIYDSEQDGVPDCWRAQYFGHPDAQASDHSRSQDDVDGTGQNNLFKYVAGLDPTNPASVFVLTIASVHGHSTQENLLFTPLALGRTYTPQFRTDLVSSVWTPLTGYPGPATNGNQVTIADTNAVGPRRFYRFDISLP